MKYLKEETLQNRKGIVQKIATPEGDKDLSVGLYVYLMMETYVPQQNFVLQPAQMRLFNKVLDKLDEDPSKDGYWEFEDAEFAIVKQIFENIAPRISMLNRYTPLVEDKLNGALNELPKKG